MYRGATPPKHGVSRIVASSTRHVIHQAKRAGGGRRAEKWTYGPYVPTFRVMSDKGCASETHNMLIPTIKPARRSWGPRHASPPPSTSKTLHPICLCRTSPMCSTMVASPSPPRTGELRPLNMGFRVLSRLRRAHVIHQAKRTVGDRRADKWTYGPYVPTFRVMIYDGWELASVMLGQGAP